MFVLNLSIIFHNVSETITSSLTTFSLQCIYSVWHLPGKRAQPSYCTMTFVPTVHVICQPVANVHLTQLFSFLSSAISHHQVVLAISLKGVMQLHRPVLLLGPATLQTQRCLT